MILSRFKILVGKTKGSQGDRFLSFVFFRTMSQLKLLSARGRAYRCLGCDRYVGEKRRVISHIYKEHVPLDEAPFYCKVCLFRSVDQPSLERHVDQNVYPAHQQKMVELRKQGCSIQDTDFLRRSHKPRYLTEGRDFQRMSAEDSVGEWRRRSKSEDPLPILHNHQPETENLLDFLLDYNPDERFTPVPIVQPISVGATRIQLSSPPVPTRVLQVPTETRVSPYVPSEGISCSNAVPAQQSYTPTPISALGPVVQSMASPISVFPTLQRTPQLPVSFDPTATSVPVLGAYMPRSSAYELSLHGAVTTSTSSLSTPVMLSRQVTSNDRALTPSFPATQIDLSSSSSTINTRSRPVEVVSAGTMTDDENHRDSDVAKAILEMSRNLVSAIEKQTFQIEMTRNTLSAFLRRMDDRDRDSRHDILPHTASKRKSRSPCRDEPEKKKKSVSSTVVVPKRH